MSKFDRIFAWFLSFIAIGGSTLVLFRDWHVFPWTSRIMVICVGLAMSRYPWIQESKERQDNPRCFCPDCGADLGNFYSNRILMRREKKRA